MKKTGTQAEAFIQAQAALLENEVISRSHTPDHYRLVNNQYNALQSWHDRHTGWRIRRSPASIRLIRTPVSFIPGYVFQTLRHPRDFACFVWTLWYAETRLTESGNPGNNQQFIMSNLAERLEEQSALGNLAAHVAPFDFKRLNDRYSLQRALKVLEELGGLELADGSLEEWVNQTGQENALWDFTEITRSLILALDMEQVRLAAQTLQGNPHTLAPARLPGTEKVNPLQRAWRTLLLGPVLLKYDDPAAFDALREHQETFNAELGQTYGWQLDLRYEYAMIIRPSGTGLGPVTLLNLGGAADQAALLVCDAIRQKIGSGEWKYPASDGCRVVPESEVAEIFRRMREEYSSRWGSTARRTSFQELLQEVYATLRQAGLMRGPDRSGNVLLLPTMARFGVSYPPEEEINPPQPAAEQPQQLTFEGATVPSPNRAQGQAGQPPAGYNTIQAAQILGVSAQSILNWINTGFLKGERQGRGWLIPAAEVERIRAIRWGNAAHSQPVPVPQNNSHYGSNGAANLTKPQESSQPSGQPNGQPKGSSPANKGGERGYNSYEAARLLGVADATILAWLKKGKLTGEKIDKNWSIPASEIERIKATGGENKLNPHNANNQTAKEIKPAGAGGEQSYNATEARRLLGVAETTILRWIRQGTIKAEKIDSSWAIPASELARLKLPSRVLAHRPPPQNNGLPATTSLQNGSNETAKEAKPANINREQAYSAAEARRLLGVSEVTILAWLKKGIIKGKKIDKHWAIPGAEIERIRNSRG